jgi:hypothetical protein
MMHPKTVKNALKYWNEVREKVDAMDAQEANMAIRGAWTKVKTVKHHLREAQDELRMLREHKERLNLKGTTMSRAARQERSAATTVSDHGTDKTAVSGKTVSARIRQPPQNGIGPHAGKRVGSWSWAQCPRGGVRMPFKRKWEPLASWVCDRLGIKCDCDLPMTLVVSMSAL